LHVDAFADTGMSHYQESTMCMHYSVWNTVFCALTWSLRQQHSDYTSA